MYTERSSQRYRAHDGTGASAPLPDHEDVELPAHLRRLWRLDAPGARGPRPALSLGAVVEAAVELADREGLEAVSMARVAEQLGFTTMALYRHVASKEELLQLMLDAAAGDPPPLPPGGDWREATVAWTDGLVDLFRRHTWAIQVPIAGIPIGPNHIAWMEAGLVALGESGLDGIERVAVVTTLTALVRADVSLARELAQHQAGRPWSEVEREHGQLLRAVLPAGRFPELTALLDEGLFDAPEPADSPEDVDLGIGFGLPLLLDGIEAYVARRDRHG